MGENPLQQYFATIREALEAHEDGSWFGSEAHAEAFGQATAQYPASTQIFVDLLSTEPRLALRFEVLRLMAALDLKAQLLPLLHQTLERAGFYPLFGRRVEALCALWEDQPLPDDELDRFSLLWQRAHWFGHPGDVEPQREALQQLASLGESGHTRIESLLSSVLEDECLMNRSALVCFREAAKLFVQHQCFEGVQLFFDFLADCRPAKMNKEIKSTVGEVLKAVRKLRPYRYPQWAVPLRSFVKHFQSIRRRGRAAEANMLIILITASTTEQALLLEDDELVDLLRGRRDAAYTTEDLEEAAALCDAVLEAGRSDGRILHIRGWLAARLDGPEAAMPYFLEALEQRPGYVYSHLAVASLAEMAGDYGFHDQHLEAACATSPTLISCHRKMAHILREEGYIDNALEIFDRGTQVKPDTMSVYELEEWFGCFLGKADIYQQREQWDEALSEVERLLNTPANAIFSSRFLKREGLIFSMLRKGAEDYKAELLRALPSTTSPVSIGDVVER